MSKRKFNQSTKQSNKKRKMDNIQTIQTIEKIQHDLYQLDMKYKYSDYDKSVIDNPNILPDVKSLFNIIINYKYEQYVWSTVFDEEYTELILKKDMEDAIINHLYSKLKNKEFITCEECKRTLIPTLMNINDCMTCYSNMLKHDNRINKNDKYYRKDIRIYHLISIYKNVNNLIENCNKLLCLYLSMKLNINTHLSRIIVEYIN
jgi:hypothetical protein